MPLDEVAATGDRVQTLRELRDLLARRIVKAEDANLAALSTRLAAVMEQLADLEPDTGKGTALDEFSKRRAERKAPSKASTEKRQQRR